MNLQVKWIAIVIGIATICEALRRILKFCSEVLQTLKSIHRYIVIHFGEHDILCEDYCTRRHISRHNMQVMAYKLSMVEEHGKAKGADA